jgi:hypothetical protein
MDRGDFESAASLFTDDVVYDVSAFGAGVQIGLAGVREAAYARLDSQPVAHHVTNPAGWRITHRIVRPRRTPLQD